MTGLIIFISFLTGLFGEEMVAKSYPVAFGFIIITFAACTAVPDPTLTTAIKPADVGTSYPSPTPLKLSELTWPEYSNSIVDTHSLSAYPLAVSGGERLSNPQWSYDGTYLSVNVLQAHGERDTAVLQIP